MTKIIYVAGYGRSGSTMLDIILNNHSQIVGIGELSYFIDEWENGYVCSCGNPYHACEFWRRFRDFILSPDMRKELRRVEHLFFLPRLLLGLTPPDTKSVYASYNQKMFSAISDITGKSIIVDSSKSAFETVGRFFALKHIARQDVFVIHLVRNGLDTLTSVVVKGSNRVMEGHVIPRKVSAIRTILGWISANFFSSLLGQAIGRKRYLFLRYEDFVANPEGNIERIAKFCGFNADGLCETIRQKASFSVGHMTGGNRIRFQQRIILQNASQQDLRFSLSFGQKALFYILAGWMQTLYGYFGTNHPKVKE